MIKKALLLSSKDFASKQKQPVDSVCFAWNLQQRRTVGIYNNPLLKKLPQLSANSWIERAVHIQESMGFTRGKTDQIDAKRIALFAYKIGPPKRPR